MIVTCPNCGSRYAVDALAIGPAGRTVQCARCNNRWFHKAEGVAPLPDVVVRPTPAGARAALPAVIPPKPAVRWRRILAVAAVVLLVVATGLFAFRREIANMTWYEARASTPAATTPSSGSAAAVATSPVTSAPAATGAAARTTTSTPQSVPPSSVLRTTGNTIASAPGPAARPARPPQADVARPNIEVDLASSKIDVVDGRYVVRGQLVNNGQAAGSTTVLRLTFKKNEEVLGERTFPLVEGPVPPGGRTSFTQMLDEPPSGTTDIVPVVE